MLCVSSLCVSAFGRPGRCLPLRWRRSEAFGAASSWKTVCVRFPWRPQEYARTCAECLYIWRVPRWAAQRRVRSISMMSVATRTTIDRGELPREIDSAPAANQPADTYRHCPKCGADHFPQRAWRGKLPD